VFQFPLRDWFDTLSTVEGLCVLMLNIGFVFGQISMDTPERRVYNKNHEK